MSETTHTFVVGLLVGMAMMVVGVLAVTIVVIEPYEDCAPTEVYAWRADTEKRESGWQCTAVADLVTEESR